MIDTVIERIEEFSPLDALSRKELQVACLGGRQLFRPRQVLFRPGEQATASYLLLDGFACRHLVLKNGKRPITGLLLPGDIFGMRSAVSQPYDHAVSSLSQLHAVCLSRATLSRWSERWPALIDALWSTRALQSSIQAKWLVIVGSSSALERLAHLFCELLVRLQAVGLATEDGGTLPLTQADLADAAGLTPVHVSRTLARLSGLGIATFRYNQLSVQDPEQLRRVAGFDPGYLLQPANAAVSQIRCASDTSYVTPAPEPPAGGADACAPRALLAKRTPIPSRPKRS
jgi:CRP-like cAMP-binding protein